MIIQVKVSRSSRKSSKTSVTNTRVAMSDFMAHAIVMDSSTSFWLNSILIHHRSSTSDDIVEAAWDAGVGVHALIWVSNSHLA